MKTRQVVPLALVSTLFLLYVKESSAIQCYVCQDCAEPSGEPMECHKKQEKCIKMHLASGDVDRMCADVKQCVGRGNGKNKRSVDDDVEDPLPKRRFVRQLLGGDGGGSSSSNSNANKNKGKGKDKDKKEEKPGVKDATEIHCCAEDGCNGAVRLTSASFYSPIFLLSLFLFLSSIIFSTHNISH